MDVGALVAVLGHRLTALERGHGRAQVADLGTRIVEVVLARDLLAAGLEDATEQVADERATSVADVERAGRVGRHELDVDRAGAGRRDATPGERGRTARSRVTATRPQPAGSARIAAMVDSSAASRSRRLRNPGGATSTVAMGVSDDASSASTGQLGGERGRDRQRRHPVWPGELEREVAGEVTVLGIGRSLDLDRRAVSVLRPARDGPAGLSAVPGASDGRTNLGADEYSCGWWARRRRGHGDRPRSFGVRRW